MQWYKVSIAPDQIRKQTGVLMKFFAKNPISSLRNANVAMFSNTEGTEVYFSPAAAELMKAELIAKFGAVPCEQPPKIGTQVLMGSGHAPQLLDKLEKVDGSLGPLAELLKSESGE